MTGISRRRFALLSGAAGATHLALAQSQGLTAEIVIQRIQGALGGDWSGVPDGLKAGDPSTVVTGIATTAMALLDVLKQAATAKTNLVLPYATNPRFMDAAMLNRRQPDISRGGLPELTPPTRSSSRKKNSSRKTASLFSAFMTAQAGAERERHGRWTRRFTRNWFEIRRQRRRRALRNSCRHSRSNGRSDSRKIEPQRRAASRRR